jgi:hypothetical protein
MDSDGDPQKGMTGVWTISMFGAIKETWRDLVIMSEYDDSDSNITW